MKLGKKPARVDARTLRLARFLPGDMPIPPDSLDWFSNITDWGMMANNVYGDCTCAGAGHLIGVWSAATGTQIMVPDTIVLDAYSRWAGWNPSDPSTDQGAVELDILNQWKRDGLFGEQILGYADPNPQDLEHVRQTIMLFGGAYIGLAMPVSAQSQSTWDVVYGSDGMPGSWGGHCVVVCGYDAKTLTCITWGRLQQMTWAFWQKYCDESHAVLGKRWFDFAVQDYKFLGDLKASLAHF